MSIHKKRLSKKQSNEIPILPSLALAVAAALLIVGIRAAGWMVPLELTAYDYFLSLSTRPLAPESRILIIAITESDIKALGRWPMSDQTLAAALSNLFKMKPAAVGLDLYRDIPVPPGEEDLRRVFKEHGPLVTVRKIGAPASEGAPAQPGVPAPHPVETPEWVGFNDLLVDGDGKVRRGLAFMDDGQNYFTAFSLHLARAWLWMFGIAPEAAPDTPGWMKIGKTTFAPLGPDDGGYVGADARGYQYLLDFSGIRTGFDSRSLSDLLEDRISPKEVAGRIVLIGSMAESLRDIFFIPFSVSPETGRIRAGVEIHATMVSQILNGALNGKAPIRFVSDPWENGWIFLWAMVGWILALQIRSLWLYLASVASTILLLVSGCLSLFQYNFWLPLVPPAAAFGISTALVSAYISVQERKSRGILMKLFSSHVSEDVAKTLWDLREQFMAGGRPLPQRVTATVLFTDLAGFTTISESLDPTMLLDWLNRYMDKMARLVSRHGGVVNKYVGDAVVAVFGVPVARSEENEIQKDAQSCVACALEMSRELEALNKKWEQEGSPCVNMRTGVATGPLVVGSLGSSHRLEYTVLGDTVNTASRLESFDKTLDQKAVNRILISENTARLVEGAFFLDEVGMVSLKGKKTNVKVYKVLGAKTHNAALAGLERGEK